MADTFNVTKVMERDQVNPDGSLGKLTVIYFETPAGNTGKVEIPAMQLERMEPEAVAALIEEKAAILDGIFNL